MATKIFNIAPNQIIPTSRVNLRRDEEGLWTADHTFLCRYVDYGNTALIDKLEQGTPITTLDPNIPSAYAFITLEDHDFQHNKGGITEIRARFTGYSETDGFTPSERSNAASYRGSIGTAPIIYHPNYIYEVGTEGAEFLDAIAALYWNEAEATGDENEYVIQRKTDKFDYNAGVITSTTVIKWIKKILKQREYDAPTVEWTVSESNKGGMTSTDLDKFGLKVDAPPGDPAKPDSAPADSWWLFSDLSEDKTDDSSTYSRTYTLILQPLDTDLYDYTIPSGP